ncbi:hypothetical protein [Fictibacillus sp. 18YEL24]|uniref:hypothetical protein n=1 Tax=Fictibacillus sp. 18YEL24 TaxID=2745875 RepID=UPI0018CD7B8B|nr:hypothetical protein [Fictibacillus sp. 18YEL24]MBH0171628.1 hypothetical protein [Fictibacillus sp. 18YEL24]
MNKITITVKLCGFGLMRRSHLGLLREDQGRLDEFLASKRVNAAASVAFDWTFGAFGEEYRVLEDGCSHILPILRGVGEFRG